MSADPATPEPIPRPFEPIPLEPAKPGLIYLGAMYESILASVSEMAPGPDSELVLAKPVSSSSIPEPAFAPANEPVASAPMTSEETALKSLAVGMLRLLDRLLNSSSEQVVDLGEQVGGLVTELLQSVDGLLGELLEGGQAPTPVDASSAPAVLESLAAGILRLVEGLLGVDESPPAISGPPPPPRHRIVFLS